MGGTNGEKNLWPEHYKVKQSRFDLEQDLFDQMTQGQVNQAQAFEIIYKHKFNPQVKDTSDPCLEKHSPPKN